jgi:L-fucose dehydrogenase
MQLELEGKVVLITGGAKGIGAAIARGVVEEKAVAVIVDRDTAAGRELQAKLSSPSSACHFVEADLCSAAGCQAAVEKALGLTKGLDALVNNAGINDSIGLEKGDPKSFLGSLEKNLHHYFYMAHYALPALKASHGCIVNIASKVAVTGQGGTSGYAAAKGAILALTREWAVELLGHGIRVNAILPAEVMTPLYRQWLATFANPEEKLASITAKIPLGKRMTAPEEIAAMVLFLLSERAGHITGQHLFVDGGYVHLDRALT